MKKSAFLISILLVIAITLTACGKEPNILCGNCGAAVPGDSFFCPNCGTAFFQNNTNNSTIGTTVETTESTANTENVTATEGKPAEPDKPAVQTPPETTHVHSFSAATCLTPQTCTCGATNGGLAGHTYQDYVCTYCGTVDADHAYEYLCLWILSYGEKNGNLYRIDIMDGDMMYSLVYDGYAYVSLSFDSEGEFCFSGLWLDDYSCLTTFGDAKIKGYVSPHSFTENSTIAVTSCTGDENEKRELSELAQAAVSEILSWLDSYLYYNDAGITIADLGFTAY